MTVSSPPLELLSQTAARRRKNAEQAHILIVDDDRRIRQLLQQFLVKEGYRVSLAADAAEARRLSDGLDFDLCIVDVMMPGEDGISLTDHIHSQNGPPVLMLTARTELEDRIVGLEAGADDYLSKPFDPRELLLRLSVILKRQPKIENGVAEDISFGPFDFNLHTGTLNRDGNLVRLTERERELLRALAQVGGAPVARQLLADYQNLSSARAVDVQLNRLRQKIEDDPSNPVHLQTVRGHGYRLVVKSGAEQA
jgi:two-component system phosphate regulon response regulator OmpR